MAHIDAILPVLKNCIIHKQLQVVSSRDWQIWRDCYFGGDTFRVSYLKKFDGKEDKADFERRRDLTPIPTYAKREVNAIRNAIANRLPDIIRREGSTSWQDAVRGEGRGINRKGLSMNSFIHKKLLAELLVMGEVGVLVDAPRLPNVEGRVLSRADVPKNFAPYLKPFAVEDIPILIEAEPESESDWSNVLLRSHNMEFDIKTGKSECIASFQYYWLDEERGDLVSLMFLDANGEPVGPQIDTALTAIPFVNFDIGGSLISDACSHQIALLNMISADTAYAVDANYSFLTRQRGNDAAGAHLNGGKGDDEVRAGSKRGLYYNRGDKQPKFISPPTEPMQMSLELRRELKAEIHDLVFGAVADLSDDGSIDGGLATIGLDIETGEQRCWDHYVIFEENVEAKREIPIVSYPDTWSVMGQKERIEIASSLIDLGGKIVGRKPKQNVAKDAVDILYRGTKSIKEIDEMKNEIDKAPYGIADPKIVIAAKKAGILCVETAALSIGAEEGEGERALADAAKRAQMVVAAQSDLAQAGRGNPDGQAGDNSEDLAREGENQGDANLKEPGNPGRPEGDDEE